MVTFRQAEKLLDTYSFEEILEHNDITEVECVTWMLEQGFIVVPYPAPVDLQE